MKRFLDSSHLYVLALLVGAAFSSALPASATQYVVTNDDAVFPFLGSVSFYSVAPNGALTLKQQVLTGGFGIGGGFFGASRLVVLDTATQQCVFASNAATGSIVGIVVSTLTAGVSANGSATDTGTSNGIGLAVNDKYLYASFTDSNTIGTFQVQPGCNLTFVQDTAVSGLQGGTINGMTTRGKMLIATYTDGSIESFDISNGTARSHSDKQLSTAALHTQGASYPNSVDITRDTRFAIFGDTSTSATIEVSAISSGRLTRTSVHQSTAGISASNVKLSPDESLLYVVNTQGATVSAMFFDKVKGTLVDGCTSPAIRGQSSQWSYLGGLTLIHQAGNGDGVYVAEYGAQSFIAMLTLTSSAGKCSLQEAPNSPFTDVNSRGLLSIDTFPHRAF